MKNLSAISKDHCNSQYSLISKARHILCGKGNKAAQKVWPDIQAQADDPTTRLSKKPNSWGFDGTQSTPEETEVFASQHCHGSMKSLLGLKTWEDERELNLPHPWFGTGKLQYPLHHTGTQGMFRTIEQSMSSQGC